MRLLACLLSGTAISVLTVYIGNSRNPIRMQTRNPALAGSPVSAVLHRLFARFRKTAPSPQWEDVFYSIASHLKAGEALPRAILAVADEGTEFPYECLKKAGRSYEAGASMLQALQAVAQGSPEMHRLAGAVEIGLSTGSNLPVLLCHSAEILAKRRSLRREARAKMAESRLTAVILSVMPWIIGAITYRQDPVLMNQALSGQKARTVMAGALGLWLIGNVAIWLTLSSVAGDRAR